MGPLAFVEVAGAYESLGGFIDAKTLESIYCGGHGQGVCEVQAFCRQRGAAIPLKDPHGGFSGERFDDFIAEITMLECEFGASGQEAQLEVSKRGHTLVREYKLGFAIRAGAILHVARCCAEVFGGA